MSHNTADCKRYSKDGSLKKGFKKPDGLGKSKEFQNFATIIKEGVKEGVAEATKILKDKKRPRDDNYSD